MRTAIGPDGVRSGAGWGSLVARRAHNPKIPGSNPGPATTNPHGTVPPPVFSNLIDEPVRYFPDLTDTPSLVYPPPIPPTPVAQRTEHLRPKQLVRVRFLAGVLG